MTYNDLDINEKLNFKAALREWATYAIQHWGEDLDKKVYKTRRGRTRRSNALRNTWYQNVIGAQGINQITIQFLQYGRYVDMGVGRGVTHTDRLVNRQLKLGSTGRQRKSWYSKRKGYETHRLREILAEKNLRIASNLVESAMNIAVTLNI